MNLKITLPDGSCAKPLTVEVTLTKTIEEKVLVCNVDSKITAMNLAFGAAKMTKDGTDICVKDVRILTR